MCQVDTTVATTTMAADNTTTPSFNETTTADEETTTPSGETTPDPVSEVGFGFSRGHYEVLTGSSVEAMSIPFTRSLL